MLALILANIYEKLCCHKIRDHSHNKAAGVKQTAKVKHQKTREPSECHAEEFIIRDVIFRILIQMKWYPGDKWERSHKDEYRSSTEYSTETPADFTICQLKVKTMYFFTRNKNKA